MKKIIQNILMWMLERTGWKLPVINVEREFFMSRGPQDDVTFRIEMQKMVNHIKPYVQVDRIETPQGTQVKMKLKVVEPDVITNSKLQLWRRINKVNVKGNDNIIVQS